MKVHISYIYILGGKELYDILIDAKQQLVSISDILEIVSYLTPVSDLDLAPPTINLWLLQQLDISILGVVSRDTFKRCPGVVKI